jgi:cell division protein ZapA
MAKRPVELRVGGQSYRVHSSASAEELERLASVVDDKIASLVPMGRPVSPQALLLAAIALAHEVEEQRRRADRIAARSRAALTGIVERVDDSLALADEVLARAASPSS